MACRAPSRLVVIGLNHKTAPLSVREALAFSADQLTTALTAFKTAFPQAEAVLLSTCNRVELYVARPVSGAPSSDDLVAFLSTFHRLPAAELHSHLYHHEDRAMIEHLFRVAASLDSMVVGETQILAQVKAAYQAACTVGTVGRGATEAEQEPAAPVAGSPAAVFHGLFQRALAAAKAIHDQTDLAAGRLSIASVAVDLAASVFDRFDDKTVLCIGAGEMSALMLRHLVALCPKQIRITNRTAEHAAALAAQFNASPVPIASLDELLIEADIILTSTGSPEPILTAGHFKSLLKPRRYRPVVIVDIAVPRDVEAAVAHLPNVYLYNIDDLEQVAAANRDQRSTQIDRSHDLLATHVEDFLQWYAARDVAPLVKALYEQFHAAAGAELTAYLQKHPELSEAERKDLDRMLHRLIGKMLHAPVSRITQQARTTARPMLAAALKNLFGLQATPQDPPAPDAE